MLMQEIFDKVVDHLLTQGARSRYHGDCQYHAPDGRKCAIGCLIPAERYKPEVEGHSARAVALAWPDVFEPGVAAWMLDDPRLTRDLQWVHDCQEPHHWATELLWLARLYNLEPSKALLDAAAAAAAAAEAQA